MIRGESSASGRTEHRKDTNHSQDNARLASPPTRPPQRGWVIFRHFATNIAEYGRICRFREMRSLVRGPATRSLKARLGPLA